MYKPEKSNLLPAAIMLYSSSKNAAKLLLRSAALLLLVSFSSCEIENIEDDPGTNPSGSISNSLHFNFKTPDWERNIDCTHLDLPSFLLDEETYYTFATSQSTNSTFYISYPKDSSVMVQEGNLKKYAITEYGMNQAPFQFSLKLPLNDGSSQRLVSQAGHSTDSFNEIVSIQYDGYVGDESVFKIKGRFQMLTSVIGEEGVQKTVSGTYHFKIKTSRD